MCALSPRDPWGTTPPAPLSSDGMRARSTPWLVIVALGACDGTAVPVSVDAGADGGTGAGEIGLLVARAICEKIDLCCSSMERSRILGAGEDRASCEMTLGAFYGFQFGPLERGVDRSLIVYDPEKMALCVETYRDSGCVAPGFASATVCAEVLSGVLDNGAVCESSFECVGGRCAVQAGQRVCSGRKADGESCTRDGECSSRFCRTGFFANICTSQPGAGPSCGGDGFWLTF
jgi:hypothetical protein